MCFALQGCKEAGLADTASDDSLSQSSISDGCTPSPSSINSLLVVKAGSENAYSATHNPCTSVTSNLWIMNDGRREVASTLNHTYARAGEYAVEAIAYQNTFKITSALNKVIVESCDDGDDCAAINSSDFANLNESVSLSFANADASASANISYSAKDVQGNITELESDSFSSDVAGVYEISAESDGKTYTKNISVLDLPADAGSSACNLKNLVLSGPSESKLDQSSYAKVNIPACLSSKVSSIEWSFSDSQSNTYSQSTLFSFSEAGEQSYSVMLKLNDGLDPIIISREISVSDEICDDCAVLADDGSNPSDRNPASDAPLSCGSISSGQTVSVGQIITSDVVSCGDSAGFQVITYTADEQRFCSNGNLISTENGPQSVLSTGACHSWIKTGSTTCTKACGGTKRDLYSCLADGLATDAGNSSLCGAEPASEDYVCDGDPDYEEIKLSEVLEKGEPTVCHSNKQGYVIDKEVTQETYRCVSHVITLVDSVTTVEEAPFCLDLKRCNDDSLSPSQAHGRLNWMNQCAADQSKIQNFFDITSDFESAPQNSYKISDDGSKIEGRPTYVTFRNDDGSVWKAPAPGTSNWRDKSTAHSDAAGLSCEIPDSAEIAGLCLSSCVTPSQIIASGNGAALPIKRAYDGILGDVQTLAPFSTILKPILMSTPVKQFITEIADSEHDIMIFTMASGSSIEYTPNHPVVTADGNLKDAADFVIGQSFVKKNGDLDEIIKIENIKYFGKVYNVYMQSSVLERNVVVINDYLTGSAYFQNEGHDFVDRKVLRSSLSK